MSEFHIESKGNCKDLLKNGLEFLEAARRCAGTDESGTIHILGGIKPTMIPAPTVVNSAFACEMFMKALLLYDGMQYPTDKDGHNLKKLYDLISLNTKKSINDFIGYSKSTGQPIFEHFVNSHANDFTKIRYYVTRPGWSELSPVTVYGYAFNLGQITQYLIYKEK